MAVGFVIVMAAFALGDALYAGALWLGGSAIDFKAYAIAIGLAALAGFFVYRRYVTPAGGLPPD